MAYARKNKYSRPESKTFTLNITSMTDMFTILLVFLLQTYSTNDFQINPENNIRLPISSVQTNPVKALEMNLSLTDLKVNGNAVAHLDKGNFAGSDIEKTDPLFIKPLFEALKAAAAAETAKNGKESDGKAILQADESLTYDSIKKVFYTASMAGFPKVRLATMVGN